MNPLASGTSAFSATGASCGARCRLAALALAGFAGALFGAGLLISGMTRPERVIAFLDLTSSRVAWDPSLALVMGGGVAVYAFAFHRVRNQRSSPWFGEKFHIPTRRDLDPSLLLGAATFGAGWGIAGFCPGPALVSAASGASSALWFAAAMLVGMALHHAVTWLRAQRAKA